MSDRTEYMREYKRQQREKARKAGLCGICCKNKPRKGLATCDACISSVNEARDAR